MFLLHDGGRLWYMDSENIMRLLMSEECGVTHNGDGSKVYDPAHFAMCKGCSVATDLFGKYLVLRKRRRLHRLDSLREIGAMRF